MAASHCGDRAIDQPARRHPGPPAGPMDPDGAVEVDGGLEAQQLAVEQQPPQVRLALVGAGSGEDFHHHRLGGRQPILPRHELREQEVGGATRGPVELDPRRRVNEDHRPLATLAGVLLGSLEAQRVEERGQLRLALQREELASARRGHGSQ